MAEVHNIIHRVNDAVPEHAVWLIAPSEIIRTRRASCFGKVILVAAGLLTEGVFAQQQMELMVSQNHGKHTLAGKAWYGHAAVIIPGAGFIDSDYAVFRRDKNPMNWDDPLHPYHPVQVKAAENMQLPPHVTSEFMQQQFRYTKLPIDDGVAAYQQGHEILRDTGQVWTLADYVDTYKTLTQAPANGGAKDF